jgi:hypothetical protein
VKIAAVVTLAALTGLLAWQVAPRDAPRRSAPAAANAPETGTAPAPRTCRVEGRVVGEDHRPIAGARVALADADMHAETAADGT